MQDKADLPNLATAEEFRAEIERLRLQCERLTVRNGILETRLEVALQRGRLTDAEREAVRFFSQIDGPHNVPVANTRAATLRGLLERLK